MKVITYFMPFMIAAVVGDWMRKTKQNVETNDIINRFKELTINACYSRCKKEAKCFAFGMDKAIFLGQKAECVLLRNYGKQNCVVGQTDCVVVELVVYEEVSAKYHYTDIHLDVFWCSL